MKDEELKTIWKMINDRSGSIGSIDMPPEQLLSTRGESIQNKVRSLLHHDLVLKIVSGIAFSLNILLYLDTTNVIYVCIAGFLLLSIMSYLEWGILRDFNRISDPGHTTRDSLSGTLVFLKRKSHLIDMVIASSQILIFVPGLMLYFYFAYGFIKPITGLSFFVFTGLALIGTIASYQRTRSQLGFIVKELTVCLSDLNENNLGFALETIDQKRKNDNRLKLLVALLLIFAWVVFVGVLKSLVG